MNIREKIGTRITQTRKELGITIKELAARTKELSAARISNWEQGTRSPGPMEARLLADKLKVSASYILCLTDNPLGERILDLRSSQHARPVPILDLKDAPHAKEILSSAKQSGLLEDSEKCIIIDRFNTAPDDANVFAIVVDDASMSPDFNEHDLVVIDTERKIKPGYFVLVYLTEKKQIVLRKYSETDACLYQLLASNPLWANINIKNSSEAMVIGTVIEHRRFW